MVHMTWHLQYQISTILTPKQRPHVKMVPLKHGELMVEFNQHPDCINPHSLTYTLRYAHKHHPYPYKVDVKKWITQRKVILEMIVIEKKYPKRKKRHRW
jgi:hypothetical protein